jgi:hypothetical protein
VAAGRERGHRRHVFRRQIVEHRLRTLEHEPVRLLLADPLFRGLHTLGEQWRAMLDAVRIGGKQVHHPVVKHALGPVLRVAAEAAGEASRSDLHPGAAFE